MPRRTDISSFLIIGAGPIVIEQAAEFEHSETLATKALNAEAGLWAAGQHLVDRAARRFAGRKVLAAILLFLPLTATEALAETTVTSTPIGRLAVVREVYVNTGISIPHVAERWKKIRLEWISQDRRLRFFLEDGGGQLDANYTVYDPRHPGGVCQGGGYPQAYQTSGPVARRWRVSLRKQLGALLGNCKAWVDPAQRRSYLQEFAGAAGDFGPALELLKRAATEEYGGWRRRCLKVRTKGHGPDAMSTCILYSAKAN